LAQSSEVRVLRRPGDHGGVETDVCSRVDGRLDPIGNDLEVRVYPPPALAVAGGVVASAADSCDAEGCFTLVNVQEPFAASPRGKPYQPTVKFGDTESLLGSIVVGPDGAAAWIACERRNEEFVGRTIGCRRPGRYAEVIRITRIAGRAHRLAHGNMIDPSSLRLRGHRIRWRDGGRTRTASL
jgi:hypothetical protein